jgi:excisionase family DNA binding protein
MSPADRPTLSVAETAELLGISRWLVQQAVRDSSLPSLRVGRRILIPRVQLDAWLSGHLSSGLVVSDEAPPEAPVARSRAV